MAQAAAAQHKRHSRGVEVRVLGQR